jgi:hypothetical protein
MGYLTMLHVMLREIRGFSVVNLKCGKESGYDIFQDTVLIFTWKAEHYHEKSWSG